MKEKCTICGSVRHQSKMVTIDGNPVHDFHRIEVETDEQWFNRVEDEITPSKK